MNFGAALKEEDRYPEAQEVMAAVPAQSAMSLAAVRGQFSEYLIRVQGMVRDAESLEVTDEDRLKFAVALGGEAAKITKKIDAKRKEVTADASDYVKAVNGFCKEWTDRLGQVVGVTKKKISDYQYRVELERRKQEEAARKAAAELQEKLRREAEEANRKAREEAARKAEEEARAKAASEAEIEAARKKAEEEAKKHVIQAPVVMAPVIPVQEKVTRTETGTSSYQVKTWVCRIVDAKAVPREYCEPSQKLLNDAVKMGVRQVSGCEIAEEISTRFRT